MSNVETSKAAYEAFGRGDIEAAFSNLSEDTVWRNNADGLPVGGTFHGKSQIIGEWLPTLGANFENFRLNIDEFIEAGDYVIAMGTSRATVNGHDIKAPVCHVWRYGPDGMIAEVNFFTDTAPAYLALHAGEQIPA